MSLAAKWNDKKIMRVVTGSAKGKKLKSPQTFGTRPIMDRVKTALFDILSPYIFDAAFLDLFAGVGGVGIEALSRGASSATFVELSPAVLKIVNENLSITGLTSKAETIRADAFEFLKIADRQSKQYDIIYVAPPQYVGMASKALGVLDTLHLSQEEGMVVIQIHPRERSEFVNITLNNYFLKDERKYGSTLLLFYIRRNDEQ